VFLNVKTKRRNVMKKILAIAAIALMIPAAAYSQQYSELDIGVGLAIPVNDTGLQGLTNDNVSWGNAGFGLNAELLTQINDNLSLGLGLDYTFYGGEEENLFTAMGSQKLEVSPESYGITAAARIKPGDSRFYFPIGIGYSVVKANVKSSGLTNGDKDYSDGGISYYAGLGYSVTSWNFEVRYSSLPKVKVENNKSNNLNAVNILVKYRFAL